MIRCAVQWRNEHDVPSHWNHLWPFLRLSEKKPHQWVICHNNPRFVVIIWLFPRIRLCIDKRQTHNLNWVSSSSSSSSFGNWRLNLMHKMVQKKSFFHPHGLRFSTPCHMSMCYLNSFSFRETKSFTVYSDLKETRRQESFTCRCCPLQSRQLSQ